MQKILFSVNNMNINGIKTSLLNLLNSIDYKYYSVDLFLLEKSGTLLKSVPNNVNVVAFEDFAAIKEMAYLPFKDALNHLIRSRRFAEVFRYCYYSIKAYISSDDGVLYRYLLGKIPSLAEEYDYAISYFGPLDVLSYYVLTKTKANKKDQWVHFDVNQINFDEKFASQYYPMFNRVIAVSEKAKKNLNERLPGLAIDSFILDSPVSSIIELSQKCPVSYKEEYFQIVTIGRLTLQKGPDIALDIARKLSEQGIKYQWHFIGGGGLFESLQKKIKQYQLDDCFILEGEQVNPYRYLVNADLYVQPSRHEGYGLTIQEAKILCLPIICTDFAGADEQIIDGISGVVVKNDIDSLKDAIIDLYLHDEKRESFRMYLQNLDLRSLHSNMIADMFPEES